MRLKKIEKTSKGNTCSLICAFYAFLCVKLSRKKQRSLKLSKRTKINKTTLLCAIKTSSSKSEK